MICSRLHNDQPNLAYKPKEIFRPIFEDIGRERKLYQYGLLTNFNAYGALSDTGPGEFWSPANCKENKP